MGDALQLVTYGDDPSQVADLVIPSTGNPPYAVVVLIHGGFWRSTYDRSLMTPLASDLAARGLAALNIEYRRVGQAGGGWPGTLADVGMAIDSLAAQPASAGLDLARVVTVGHSAGGHLALWAASRPGLPAGAPGASPSVVVHAAVSQAGVADLAAGDRAGLGAGAVAELMGGHADAVPDRYAIASPAQRLPLGVRQLLVHGSADDIVPVSQSIDYAQAATASGDDVELVELAGIGHFELIDPKEAAWTAVTDRLADLSS